MPSAASKNSIAKTRQFTSLTALTQKALTRISATWVTLLILQVAVGVLSLLLGLATVGTILATGASVIKQKPEIYSGGLLLGGSISVVIFILLVVLLTILGLSMLLAIMQSDKKISIGTLFSQALKLIIPSFLTGCIVQFLTLGGMFFFFIPGLIIAILTGFAGLEVASGSSRYFEAIRKSVQLVSQNFGELFARILVLFLGVLIISWLPGAMLSMGNGNPSANLLLVIVNLILQAVLGWFSMAFIYELYLEAKKVTDFKKKTTTVWMYIVGTLGWIMMIFIGFTLWHVIRDRIENGWRLPSFQESNYESTLHKNSDIKEMRNNRMHVN